MFQLNLLVNSHPLPPFLGHDHWYWQSLIAVVYIGKFRYLNYLWIFIADIIYLTETWLSDYMYCNSLSDMGFQMYRKDRTSGSGGGGGNYGEGFYCIDSG